MVISVTKGEYRAYLSVHMLVEITEIIFPDEVTVRKTEKATFHMEILNKASYR